VSGGTSVSVWSHHDDLTDVIQSAYQALDDSGWSMLATHLESAGIWKRSQKAGEMGRVWEMC